MTKLQTALERALPIVAAAYGEQFGVRVVLSGSDACTDGQTIMLPMLDNITELRDVLFGYLAHEASHVRDSDFSVVRSCQSPIEKGFLNLIEDIRIEGLIQEVFPGTQFTLTAMEEYIFHKGWTPVPHNEENEATQLSRYLYHRLYGEYLNRECYQPLIVESRKVVEETFPEGFFIRLDGLLGKYMGSMTSTRDALKIARGILKALKDAEEEERQQEDQESSQGGQSQNADANDSQSDSSNDDDDTQQSSTDEDSDGHDSNPGNSLGDDSSQSNLDAQDESDGDDSTDDSSEDGDTDEGGDDQGGLHERLINESDLPEDVISQLRGELEDQAVEDNKGSSSFTIDTSAVGEQGKNQGDTSSLQAGILASSAIRSKLIGLLQAQTRSKQWLHTRGKRVDGKRLTRLAQGDSRVFIQREEMQRPDTAVHVLLDASGSMEHIQDIANQATASMAAAISAIPQCDIAVSMFPGQAGQVSPLVKRGQPVRANLGRLVVKSHGGTPLAEAMLFAVRELAASNRQRKVLIIITDGAPNNGAAVHYMNDLIVNHVDTYAIGIGNNAVRNYFEKWSVINDVKELQRALFQIAGNFLDLH